MMIKRFSKGHTKIGHINCIFDNGEETDMTLHDNDDNLNPYDETGKTSIEKIIDQMNHLEDAKIQVIKDNNILKNKIKQLETRISHLKWENEELRERGLEMKYEDDLKTINQDIKEIYLILIELESLETGENADYTDVSTDIGYCKMLLKDRLISLKRKAETEGAII